MRTRGESKSGSQSSGKDAKLKPRQESESGTLTDISSDGVKKVLTHTSEHGSRGKKKQNDNLQQLDSVEFVDERKGKQFIDTRITESSLEDVGCGKNDAFAGGEDDEMNDSDWEECPIPKLDTLVSASNDINKGFTIEFDEIPDSKRQKRAYRATAEDKELAELVHKVHLLCLLARGRIVDNACDDPLIQASLLSILPSYLSKVSTLSRVTVKEVAPLIRWFRGNFSVGSTSNSEISLRSALASALESREGTPEELAALSVALFRALNLTTRFVSILNVASLKPGGEKYEPPSQDRNKLNQGIFKTSTLMVAKQEEASTSLDKVSLFNEHDNVSESYVKDSSKTKDVCLTTRSKLFSDSDGLKDKTMDLSTAEAGTSGKPNVSKRKGDIEFEMQLAMALTATSAANPKNGPKSNLENTNSCSSNVSSPFKGTKRVVDSSVSGQGISTAVGSKKVGSSLYWAEVYCNGENLDGKWVHADAVNGIIDAEQAVEAAVAACRTSLRYVVAFANGGAKDVTRRYCTKWHKIAANRVNSLWWDSVLAPLRQLESAATGGSVDLGRQQMDVGQGHEKEDAVRDSDHTTLVNTEASASSSFITNRSALEDMELATRALTEPLPTNQQAYKNHGLYVLERWLNKNQILHPKGPVLGFCSGHPVYPRTCVQTLRTKERWLRDGLQVKANELPAKVLKRTSKLRKVETFEDDGVGGEDSFQRTMELYGRWQMEPLLLPHAVNGIVPKNERGQVDVWSEKCLPTGTVHIRLPRMFSVAKRFGIDYAPAMVGFEYRSGRTTPVFDGIVVCAEFKDTILEAYAEEQERKEAAEKRRNEAQAASRWYQLLSSIITRERLKNRYAAEGNKFNNVQTTSGNVDHKTGSSEKRREPSNRKQGSKRQLQRGARAYKSSRSINALMGQTENHEHVFLEEDQSFDEDTSVRTKRCRCGFSVQVEEM